MSADAAGRRQRKRVLEVVSHKMDKTVTVVVRSRVMHPIYKKFHLKRYRYMAHDPENTCRVGDIVRIEESRPLSKNKRWRLAAVLKRAE